MPRKKRHTSRNKRIPAYEGYRPTIVTTTGSFVRRGRTYKLVVRGNNRGTSILLRWLSLPSCLVAQLKQGADEQDQRKPVKGDSEDSAETKPL